MMVGKENRMKVDTVTTSDDMDHLWGEVNKTNGKHVRVSREVLSRLLLDHGRLLNYYEGKPIQK